MDKLEYVLALAEERSMTRAAAKLFISQPTLTNYINRLERDLGVKLFDRTTQPISITRAGTVYIEDMKKIQNYEQTLQAKLQLLKSENQSFYVGIPSIRGEHLLPQIIGQMKRNHPEISIWIENQMEDVLEKKLEHGRIDVAIGLLSRAYPGIHYETLREEQVYIVVAKDYLRIPDQTEGEGTLESPYLIDGTLLNGCCLLVPGQGGGQYRSAMLMIEKYGIVAGTTIHCANSQTLYKIAAEGSGILLTVPGPFQETFPQFSENMIVCQLQREPVSQTLCAGFREDGPNVELVHELIDSMKKQYTNR